MTKVGKILVFFNLIFSLVVGAFVVVVYISQRHWAADYNDLAQRYQVVDASNAAYQKQLQQAQDYSNLFNTEVLNKIASDKDLNEKIGLQPSDNAAAKLDKIKATLAAALKDDADQKVAADKLRDELTEARKNADRDNAALVTARAEADKHQAESADTRVRLAAEEKKNLDLVEARDKEKDERVAASIRATSFEQRMLQLEKENDKLARDNQRLVAGGVSVTTAMKKEGPNPPLDSVEGQISEVDPSGLVRITIGSDAGLVKGNTLEVYRLNTQIPDQSKYLGRLRLIEVRNTEAVGQLMGKPPVPPQPGDTVSSKILGG